MRSIRQAWALGAVTSVLLLWAAPAHAEWCWDVCQGDFACDQACNNGGGDYTTCSGAGYTDCCYQSRHVVQPILGAYQTGPVPLWCHWHVIANVYYCWNCPSGQTCGSAGCEEWDDGWGVNMDCCDAWGCGGQQSC